MLNQSTLDGIFSELKWNGEIPLKYRRRELATSSHSSSNSSSNPDWKRIGNEHFVSKRYVEAVTAYTMGMKEEQRSEQVDVLANRSAAYLALDKHKLALIDAESALAIDPAHMKCIYRKSTALFGLALYAKALAFLTAIPASTVPENQKIINNLLTKCNNFIAQTQNGVYPWQEILKVNGGRLDVAEFRGPVIVKHTPAKGQGMFATKTIKAGELILASKAFAFVDDNDLNEMIMNVNIGTNRLKRKSQTQLVSSILHILKEEPEKCAELRDLYAGPQSNNVVAEDGSNDLYDMKRINAICSYNAFGSGTHELPGRSDCTGLWITPSFINHSCVDANGSWLQIGNFFFIRAFRDIPADEEILIAYVPPDKLISQQNLDNYSFVCDCRLCARDRNDSEITRSRRAALLSELNSIVAKYVGNAGSMLENRFDGNVDGVRISRIMKSFDETRMDAPDLNFGLWAEIMKLAGCCYYKNQHFLAAADHLMNLFKSIEHVAALAHISLEACVNIIAAFIRAGHIPTAQRWLKILKTRATLVFGTYDIIYTRFPSTVELMQQFGFDV